MSEELDLGMFRVMNYDVRKYSGAHFNKIKLGLDEPDRYLRGTVLLP